MATFYIPVAGTNAWSDDSVYLEEIGKEHIRWWQEPSKFYDFMRENGFEQPKPYDPFIWTTNLDGTSFWRRWWIFKGAMFRIQDHRDWIAGAGALRWYVNACCKGPVNLIVHSHGLQVAAYACEQGLVVDKLITIGSPVRHDMMRVYYEARKNIRRWLAITDGNNDRWQLLGQIGDGRFSWFTRQNLRHLADLNQGIPNIQHSRILSDPDAFHYWHDYRWLDFLREK